MEHFVKKRTNKFGFWQEITAFTIILAAKT